MTYFEIMYIAELSYVYDKFDNTTFSNILELGQRRVTEDAGMTYTDGTAAQQEFCHF